MKSKWLILLVTVNSLVTSLATVTPSQAPNWVEDGSPGSTSLFHTGGDSLHAHIDWSEVTNSDMEEDGNWTKVFGPNTTLLEAEAPETGQEEEEVVEGLKVKNCVLVTVSDAVTLHCTNATTLRSLKDVTASLKTEQAEAVKEM